ncbi:MAG: hypothetical protein IKV94_02655 [Clostridia bacterium]|nr:hypothetical protein [Clostridia bacterium]MBR6517083.1 hypothetical protein [Bacilli bacterium]
MLVNSKLTIYHKGLDEETRLETWTRFNYDNVWFFGGKGAGIRKGYQDANDVEIRIWYELNDNLDINNFAIGDIIVQDALDFNIEEQNDLSNYLIYNITSINNNDFGYNQHVHIGGK